MSDAASGRGAEAIAPAGASVWESKEISESGGQTLDRVYVQAVGGGDTQGDGERMTNSISTGATTSRMTLAALLVAGATAGVAQAEVIPYGDFLGDHVLILNVVEDNNQTLLALLGVPMIAGDTLSTPNTNFVAESPDDVEDILSAQLTFEIQALPGELINSVTITESGTYEGMGADAFSSVTASASVDAGGGLLMDGFADTFSGTGSGDWSFSWTFDFAPASSVFVTVDNSLLAVSALDQFATIDKSTLSITAGVVPAPGALVTLGIACLGVRRRSRG